ncbi:glycosyltransferase [Postechiella marina]|uniref:Glycosyltransferase n=1 Tax=Postechiella marina TaxID=943941 RepID=A0ABP8CEH2_9FLAO
MISILIPTFNYNIVPLVNELYKQVTKEKINFEILVYDDGSISDINKKNEAINTLNNCLFKVLPNNIGRSAIRNLLGQNAKYENLLFLDADVFPFNKNFIKNYINHPTNNVVYGGIVQTNKPPKKPKKLRWIYTKKREQFIINSANFLISKDTFNQYSFDESLKKYGCEDVCFFEVLINNNIQLNHINNPVVHYGNDNAKVFIKKTNQALENLMLLIDENKISINKYQVSKLHNKVSYLKLDFFISFVFKLIKPLLIINFNSSFPSLILYDFYRLGYFCTLKIKK